MSDWTGGGTSLGGGKCSCGESWNATLAGACSVQMLLWFSREDFAVAVFYGTGLRQYAVGVVSVPLMDQHSSFIPK